jgi:hypothetical protein
MRKINQVFAEAFRQQIPKTLSNTTTDGQAIWLHGNKIIERRDNDIWVTLAGWDTVTTRSRINGVIGSLGSIYRQNGQPYVLSKRTGQHRPISSTEWINLGSYD